MKKLEVKYGLPKDVYFCKRCVISNQRPSSEIEIKHNINTKKRTINFDKNRVCDACMQAEKKENIDWESREEEGQEIIKLYDN